MINKGEFREWLISKQIHFEDGENGVWVTDESLYPFEKELKEKFPDFMCTKDAVPSEIK